MKRAFLIHGWDGYPEEGWRPWLKQKLEEQGFDVTVPAMPDTARPEMNAWVEHLKSVVGQVDDQCYFVGHSLGCITILRYLEQLHPEEKVGGVVLVAGFASNLGYEQLESFFPGSGRVDWEKIKSHSTKFVAIHSDNDPYVSTHYGSEIFQSRLGAEYILEHDKKHFSGDDGITELPLVFDVLLNIS